jgi:hypothetical protein
MERLQLAAFRNLKKISIKIKSMSEVHNNKNHLKVKHHKRKFMIDHKNFNQVFYELVLITIKITI